MSISLLHPESIGEKTNIRMLKLYCYPCFRTPVYKNTQTLKPRIKMIRKVHICTEMLEHSSPKPGSLPPNEIGRATSIVTSRHIRARYVLFPVVQSYRPTRAINKESYLMISAKINSVLILANETAQGKILDSLRFNSSLVRLSLFLSKSKNSSGMASAVGSSSGS